MAPSGLPLLKAYPRQSDTHVSSRGQKSVDAPYHTGVRSRTEPKENAVTLTQGSTKSAAALNMAFGYPDPRSTFSRKPPAPYLPNPAQRSQGPQSRLPAPSERPNHVLRRKKSIIGDYVSQRRAAPEHAGLSISIPRQDEKRERPVGSAIASTEKLYTDQLPRSQTGRLQTPVAQITHTPVSDMSATPSLRHDSPSVFSQASYLTTPTSITAASPTASHSPIIISPYTTSPSIGRRYYDEGSLAASLVSYREKHTATKGSPVQVSRPSEIKSMPHSTTPVSQRSLVRPPEFAHLERSATVGSATSPPVRPSREGVADIGPIAQTRLITTSIPLPRHMQSPPLPQSPPSQAQTSKGNQNLTKDNARGGAFGRTIPLRNGNVAAAPKADYTKSLSITAKVMPKSTTSSPVVSESSKIRPVTSQRTERFSILGSKRGSSGASSRVRSSYGSTTSEHDDFLSRKGVPQYLRSNDSGQVTASAHSSSASELNVGSRFSSAGSVGTSQSSLQPATSVSETPFDAVDKTSQSERSSRKTIPTLSKPPPRKLSKTRKDSRAPSSVTAPSVDGSEVTTDGAGGRSRRSAFKSLFSRSSARSKQPDLKSIVPTKTTTILVNDTKIIAPRAHTHFLADGLEAPQYASEDAQLEEIAMAMDDAIKMGDVAQRTHIVSEIAKAEEATAVSELDTVEVSFTLSPELRQEHSFRDDSANVPIAIDAPPSKSRLPRVGRIPQATAKPPDAAPNDMVVKDTKSARSGQSFSRPFSISRPRISNDANIVNRAAERAASVHSNSGRFSRSSLTSSKTGSGQEFLVRRKDSDLSFSSSSGTYYFPVPSSLPASGNAADEIWPEYDDLIARVDSEPKLVAQSQLSSRSADAVDQKQSKTVFPNLAEMAATLKLSPFIGTERRSHDFDTGKASSGSSNGSAPRRTPSTRQRIPIAVDIPRKTSGRSINERFESASTTSTDSSVMSKLANFQDCSLQLAALKVCKWLTFGRILFSPAHEMHKNGQLEDVLVVDGLGKDWSFFCAENYRDAAVTGLSPAPYQAAQSPALRLRPPKSYRHIRHPLELGVKFPLKRNTFNVVVFRFPMAMDERNLSFAISECKRVLKPGGYLEITLLDLDLANMGTRARRAIKKLKINLQAHDLNISLKSATDNVQYIMGRRGFENMNKCVIGVPVSAPLTQTPTLSREQSNTTMSDLSVRGIDQGSDGDITRLAAKVGRYWYSQCYERMLGTTHGADDGIWADQDLLHECKLADTTFKLLICYAQKPTEGTRKTRSL